MAEEGKVKVEDKKVEGTTESNTENSNEVTLSPREQAAKTQGWKTKEEWVADGGDPDEHRSAREFLDRGELLESIRTAKSELRNVQTTVANLTEHNKKVYVAGYENALKDLKLRRAMALEKGDIKSVTDIEDLMDKTKDHIAAVKATPTGMDSPKSETPEFIQFKKDNSWYLGNQALQKWAHGEAIEWVSKNPGKSEADVYAYIEKKVKVEFPEKFQKLPPSPDGASSRTSGTQGNGSSSKGSTAFDRLMAELPEDQVRVAKDFVKRGVMTKEKYVEDYEAMRGR